MKIKNKVMVVTGGGSGIGRELVLNLVKNKSRVAAVDINERNLKETLALAGELRDQISFHVIDVTDCQAVSDLPGQVIAEHGEVDGLINNAGIIQPFVEINEMERSKIDKMMDVNFYGQVNLTKAFLPYFLERPEAHIANISSMGGFFPIAGQSLYGASKAAVKLFSEGLYLELSKTNVHVTVVFPGATDTNINKNSDVEIQGLSDELRSKFSMVTPEKAATKIIKAIEHNRYEIYIGKDAIAMNILYRINPLWAIKFMFNQMKILLDSGNLD